MTIVFRCLYFFEWCTHSQRNRITQLRLSFLLIICEPIRICCLSWISVILFNPTPTCNYFLWCFHLRESIQNDNWYRIPWHWNRTWKTTRINSPGKRKKRKYTLESYDSLWTMIFKKARWDVWKCSAMEMYHIRFHPSCTIIVRFYLHSIFLLWTSDETLSSDNALKFTF